ncbi:endo-1,4-beta-xylanase [Streptosporangiaceae bacterium NEAU-GS5]|nr:endo-1,4-beta-xylanase [Streptosporangiaceae bacterium NEAU-GS5]
MRTPLLALFALLAGLLTAVAPGSPAGAAVVQIAKYDFENGTTQGWVGRGSAAVAVSPAAAHSGTAGLATTGRTDTWNGAAINPPFDKGVTYSIEAWVKAAPGAPSSTIALTMQRTSGGADSFERVAAATVTDSAWVQLSGTYTFTVDSTLTLYFESSDATASFYVDDVLVTSDSDPTQSGLTTDFETGANEGWSPRASATLTPTTAVAHGGTHALQVTTRQASWDGAQRSVLGKMAKGSKYDLSIWVRSDTAQNLGLSIERRLAGTPAYQQLVSPRAVAAGQWVQLHATYTLAFDVDFLAVYIESDTSTDPYYLDDFTLTYIAPKPIQTDIPSLKDALPYTVGTAFSRSSTLGEHARLLLKHYESVTPGNALKWDATEPSEGNFTFDEGDYLVNWAVDNGLKFRGHTLVWHSQVPDWVFKNADGTTVDKATLLQRETNHIRAVVGRYKGKIGTWDVVNEVIDENQPDGLRRSPWYQIAGLDYIRTAFRVAHETDPAAKLFINDYNTELPRKRQALFNVVKKLKAEGVPIDGVGHQVHVNIEQPPASYVEDTIQKFATLNVDQQITELDVSVYTDFVSTYATVPSEVIALQGYRYKELFDVFKRQASHLSAVTIWGLADDETWLSNFPINRLNPPLPFDDELQAKPAFWGIVDPTRLPPLTRTTNAPAAEDIVVNADRELQWDLQPDTLIARVGNLSADFQVRVSTTGLYVFADVNDATGNAADTITFTVDGTAYKVKRGAPHSTGFPSNVKGQSGGYRAEARVPNGSAFAVTVHDAAANQDITWNGTLNKIPAIKTTDVKNLKPVIDGNVDAVWSQACEITTGTWLIGTSGATAKVRTLWSGNTLYVLAKVTDPTLSEESPNAYEQDSVEIFVDPANNKSKGYDDDDGQYRISFTNKQTIGGTFDAFGVKDNLTSAAKVVTGGYVVEAAIKLPTITPAKGSLLGFDVQVNDATGATRTAAAGWNDPTGLSYLNTSRWGVARLVK